MIEITIFAIEYKIQNSLFAMLKESIIDVFSILKVSRIDYFAIDELCCFYSRLSVLPLPPSCCIRNAMASNTSIRRIRIQTRRQIHLVQHR